MTPEQQAEEIISAFKLTLPIGLDIIIEEEGYKATVKEKRVEKGFEKCDSSQVAWAGFPCSLADAASQNCKRTLALLSPARHPRGTPCTS